MNIWYEIVMQSFWACWGMTGTQEQYTLLRKQWSHFNLLIGDQQQHFIAMLKSPVAT